MSPGPRAQSTQGPRLPFEQRTSQLIDVAEELFVAHGYAAVTMEDIARAAGVSRPIVYRHFESREGAYLACARRAREVYEQRLLAKISPDDPVGRLAVAADEFFRMLEEHPGKWRLVFGSNAVLPGAFSSELTQLRFGTIHIIAQALRDAAPDAPELVVESTAHAVSGVGERLGHWWLTRPDLSRAQLVTLFVDFVTSGVGPHMPG